MLDAAALTNELFNPTMARVIDALGYSVDFDKISADHSAATSLPTVVSPTGIHLRGNHLALDAGVALDPGAIGKGLAGDILCREFRAAGAIGVFFLIAGDVLSVWHVIWTVLATAGLFAGIQLLVGSNEEIVEVEETVVVVD
jgi:thiamine biosynthesis lipoprotein